MMSIVYWLYWRTGSQTVFYSSLPSSCGGGPRGGRGDGGGPRGGGRGGGRGRCLSFIVRIVNSRQED